MYCLVVLHHITVFLYILLQRFTYLFNLIILFKKCSIVVFFIGRNFYNYGFKLAQRIMASIVNELMICF
jgi:hypothetical protein